MGNKYLAQLMKFAKFIVIATLLGLTSIESTHQVQAIQLTEAS